jgi:hypothetical protein
MLEPDVVNRIRDDIAATTGPRLRGYREAIEAMLNRMNARGLLQSGNTIREFARLAEDELAIRADIVWEAIARAHAAMVAVTTDLTLTELREQLAHHVHAEAVALRGATLGRVRQLGLDASHVDQAIGQRSAEVLAAKDIKARYYVDRVRRGSGEVPAGTVINIGRDVHLLQTGSHAIGNVSIKAEDRERLADSLQNLLRELEQNREIEEDARNYGREITGELIEAVRAEKPNPPRIHGLLTGLAQTVQTVASLGPAWRQLRDLAAAVGVWMATG